LGVSNKPLAPTVPLEQAVGANGPARASRWRQRLAGRTWLRTPYVPLKTCTPQVTRKMPAIPEPSAIRGPGRATPIVVHTRRTYEEGAGLDLALSWLHYGWCALSVIRVLEGRAVSWKDVRCPGRTCGARQAAVRRPVAWSTSVIRGGRSAAPFLPFTSALAWCWRFSAPRIIARRSGRTPRTRSSLTWTSRSLTSTTPRPVTRGGRGLALAGGGRRGRCGGRPAPAHRSSPRHRRRGPCRRLGRRLGG
jgi:hypothetical protein